jgi:hypothetical protein
LIKFTISNKNINHSKLTNMTTNDLRHTDDIKLDILIAEEALAKAQANFDAKPNRETAKVLSDLKNTTLPNLRKELQVTMATILRRQERERLCRQFVSDNPIESAKALANAIRMDYPKVAKSMNF